MTNALTVVATEQRSPHNRVVAFVLALFFGYLGIHRFYVGKVWTGLFFFFTGGGFGIWWLIDIILLAIGRFKDGEGRVLGPPQYVPKLDRPAPKKQLPAPIQHAPEPDPYEEEAMRDPLQDKFDALEDELKKR